MASASQNKDIQDFDALIDLLTTSDDEDVVLYPPSSSSSKGPRYAGSNSELGVQKVSNYLHAAKRRSQSSTDDDPTDELDHPPTFTFTLPMPHFSPSPSPAKRQTESPAEPSLYPTLVMRSVSPLDLNPEDPFADLKFTFPGTTKSPIKRPGFSSSPPPLFNPNEIQGTSSQFTSGPARATARLAPSQHQNYKSKQYMQPKIRSPQSSPPKVVARPYERTKQPKVSSYTAAASPPIKHNVNSLESSMAALNRETASLQRQCDDLWDLIEEWRLGDRSEDRSPDMHTSELDTI